MGIRTRSLFIGLCLLASPALARQMPIDPPRLPAESSSTTGQSIAISTDPEIVQPTTAAGDSSKQVASVQSLALSVVIIEINNTVDDTNYKSKLLADAFSNAGNRLSQYFQDKFHVTAKIISSSSETTADALSHYFRDEFPAVADRKVTALFILSHGEMELRNDDPGFKNDLLLVTSDTLKSALPRNSLSFTRDLYPILSNLHPGSVTLVFIDACHSGSANNQLVSVDSLLRDQAGLKMLIMASSLSTELESEASFTDSLVDLWTDTNSGECVTPKLSTLKLQERIAHKLSLSAPAAPAPPEVIVDYNGSLCLDALAEHKGLLVLSNPGDVDILVTISDPDRPTTDPSDDASPFKRSVKAHGTLAVRLNRDRKYILQVWGSDVTSQEKEEVDLAKLNGIRVRKIVPDPQIDASKETAEEAAVYREASVLASDLEIPEPARIKALLDKANYLTAISRQ